MKHAEEVGDEEEEVEEEEKETPWHTIHGEEEVRAEAEVDEGDAHAFVAERVWDQRTLRVHFGGETHEMALEGCSPGCRCWTDDVGGCRIGYVVEHILKLPLDAQGWIVAGKMVDYFDEDVAQRIFEADANLTVFVKRTV